MYFEVCLRINSLLFRQACCINSEPRFIGEDVRVFKYWKCTCTYIEIFISQRTNS